MELNEEGKWIRSQCKMYDRNYSQYPVEIWPEVYNNTNDSKIVDCKRITYEIDKSEDSAAMEVRVDISFLSQHYRHPTHPPTHTPII